MLQFFQRHQRIIFIFTTIVIVISFSFFGVAPQEASGPNPGDRVIGRTLDGTAVRRKDVENMVLFLSSDRLDKVHERGMRGINFLNDGVVRKDFLESGLADLLVEQHFAKILPDMQRTQRQEKHFKPYSHTQVWFLNASSVWDAYAPGLGANFKRYMSLVEKDPSLDSFGAKVQLYLSEKSFPPMYLRQVLLAQEQQYEWIRHDPRLDQEDLALFGYHNLQDWFGQNFLHLVAQAVIHGASVAKDLGYTVSDSEVLAELRLNAELSYREMEDRPLFTYASSQDYYMDQLRILNMSEAQAIGIWKDVLLFRRYFNDVGSSVFLDALSYDRFQNYSKEAAKLAVYELPEALRLANFEDLQELETYLGLVSNKSPDELLLPARFLPLAEVEKRAPRLVQRRFLLDLAEVDRAALQSRVSIRSMWDWETSEGNWSQLTEKFAALAVKTADNRDSRYQAIDELDDATRSQVHSFARDRIVAMHPEWLEEALDKAASKTLVLSLRSKGGSKHIKGLETPQKLVDLLDGASEDDKEAIQALRSYTSDDRHFYRIELKESVKEQEVLTFAEARQDGTISELTDQTLEEHYRKIRGQDPINYRNEEGAWKTLDEVRDRVAESLFSPIIQAVIKHVKEKNLSQSIPSKELGTFVAKHRWNSFVLELLPLLKASKEDSVLIEGGEISDEGTVYLPPSQNLSQQWGLIKRSHIARRSEEKDFDIKRVLAGKKEEWSNLQHLSSGNVAVYQYLEPVSVVLMHKNEDVQGGQKLLASEAKKAVFREVFKDVELTTEYLSPSEEEETL